MAELEESKKAAAQPDSPGKTPSTGTPADTQPNTPAPGLKTGPKMEDSDKRFHSGSLLISAAVDDSATKADDGEKEPKKEGELEKNGKEPPPKANNEVRMRSAAISLVATWLRPC